MPGRDQPSMVGIVLAGGASRRFGSDKLAAELDGRPLVVHALDALRGMPGGVARVLVAAPPLPAAPTWLDIVVGRGGEIVRDREAFGGPLGGLASALSALRSIDVALVVGGDMPRLDPVLLRSLVDEILANRGADVACLATDGQRHPLPLALAIGPARRVAEDSLQRGERSLRAFLEALDGRVRTIASDPRSTVDVDTPEDLRALRT